jgi:glutamine synthetase
MPSFGKKDVLRIAKGKNVKFVRLWFTDILGFLKSFAITIRELEGALEDGMGFDGSSIAGFVRIDESDMVAMPDPSTFRILPWKASDQVVAVMFCDILEPNGNPHQGDPRWVLKKNLERAAKMGYTFNVGPELEYFYFQKSTGKPEALDQGGYFDLTPLDVASELRKQTVTILEEMGIPVEYSHHEVAPSQHEIDLKYRDALTMADSTMIYRLVVKEVALKNNVFIPF